jgi:Tfp pilus assembly protein PilO
VSTLLRSKAGVVAVAAGTAAVIAAAGWFLLVKPKQGEAKSVDAKIVVVERNIAARRAELARPKAEIRVRPSDLYRLSKALPGSPDIAGVLLEVNRLAGLHGITFKSIESQPPVPGTSYMVHPFQVTLEGRFANVSSFLGDLRKLVRVKKQLLDVRGRLMAVDGLQLSAPDEKKFPTVKAIVTLDAFAFNGIAPPAASETTTSTDATTQTSPSTSGTDAAGVTP